MSFYYNFFQIIIEIDRTSLVGDVLKYNKTYQIDLIYTKKIRNIIKSIKQSLICTKIKEKQYFVFLKRKEKIPNDIVIKLHILKLLKIGNGY